MNLGFIVEGHGEVSSVPLLLRRILGELAPGLNPQLLKPHRVARSKLAKSDELKRAIEFMARKVGPDGRILVLLDADDDLPCELGPQLLGWAREQRPQHAISVVVAKREYEAWFLTAAQSLQGCRGLPTDLRAPSHPETIRDAKGWLGQHMGERYRETIDQPALTSLFDLTAARRADSFDKLFRDVGRLFDLAVPPRPTP